MVILLSAKRCAKHDARNFVQNMRKKDAQKEYLHTSSFHDFALRQNQNQGTFW